MNKTVLTGITSTGELTIGNYLGAIKPLLEFQKQNFKIIIFVANLHAITNRIEKQKLKDNILKIVKTYYACGINDRNIIFVQSTVLEHTQLSHILLCHTTIGELSRMTQFKDKSQNIKSNNNTNYIPSGLLTYPALMAADILLYQADIVPVGKDQKQHIELTKTIAKRMNEKYGKLFKIPNEHNNKKSIKIMDLKFPNKKMSKSSKDKNSYISIFDTEQMITKKIKSAITDSENKIYYNPKEKPGVSNLINIYAEFSDRTIESIEKEFENMNYGELKTALIKIIWAKLEIIQNKYAKLKEKVIIKKMIQNSKKAKAIANKTLTNVENKIGLNIL